MRYFLVLYHAYLFILRKGILEKGELECASHVIAYGRVLKGQAAGATDQAISQNHSIISHQKPLVAGGLPVCIIERSSHVF